ncbi:SDR family oxidoreductase [Nocardia sp. R7R-8]|uniref:SDR family oxidoreductase n=1 Tax=Nocardia sp. R7R-8 TaxID=3459304 RepID=UPI00403DF01C
MSERSGRPVAVVIGTGGMGLEIARRQGPGVDLVLADVNARNLETTGATLRDEGYSVTPIVVDVSAPDSVAALAEQASALGDIRAVAHTAGVSGATSAVSTILAVDLLGVALVIEEFGKVIAPGGAGVVIASMAGHFFPGVGPDEQALLASSPARELLALPIARPEAFPDSGAAYSFAKYANLIRVKAGSVTWGHRGARINSISPGVIATPMAAAELAGEHGGTMKQMIATSNAKRIGTPTDIAAAADFLLGPAASFISGTDLLVDGGVVAATVADVPTE